MRDSPGKRAGERVGKGSHPLLMVIAAAMLVVSIVATAVLLEFNNSGEPPTETMTPP